MAAYAFARLRFKGRDLIFIIYLGTMMIPFQVVMIPQFQIIKVLGLIDNIWSLIVIGIFNAFGTFLLRQFFLTLPRELEEAAMIDGCSYPRIFWEIIIKNSKPALMTLVIFTFMNTWNDFPAAAGSFLNSQEKLDPFHGPGKVPGDVCDPVESDDGRGSHHHAAHLGGVHLRPEVLCTGHCDERY